MGFGHKGADASMQAGTEPHGFVTFGDDPLAQIGDGFDVVHGLFGMPDHEIEFDGLPAALVDRFGGLDQVFVRDGLINDITHAFGSSFGGQGEARLTGMLQSLQQVNADRVDT